MGLQVRKRSKGKNGWLNASYSRKGVGVSGSIKSGSVTYNTGDLSKNRKTPSRLTVNLGNGYRWVSYGKKKSSKSSSEPSDGTAFIAGVLLFLIFIIIATFHYWSILIFGLIWLFIYIRSKE